MHDSGGGTWRNWPVQYYGEQMLSIFGAIMRHRLRSAPARLRSSISSQRIHRMEACSRACGSGESGLRWQEKACRLIDKPG